MQFSLYANPQTDPTESASSLRDGMVRLVETADEVGFDQVMAGQHYLSDFTQLQLLPYLARLTGEVDSLDIATGIVLLPFYHPVEIAEQFSTIDALHDNRTILGVGAGYRDVEFEAFGIPKSDRVSRFEETLELTRRLLSESSVTARGEHFSIEDATIPVKPTDPPPVWIAANADRAVERAARRGDAWLINPHATIEEIRTQKRELYDPIRESAGEATDVPVIREGFVAETREAAVDAARDSLWEKYNTYLTWGQDEAMEDPTDLHRPFEELAEDRFILGTPADVCSAVERYERELDASTLVLRTHWPGFPYERARESIRLIGDEVIPNV